MTAVRSYYPEADREPYRSLANSGNAFVDLLRRIGKAVWESFVWLGRMLENFFRIIVDMIRPIDKLQTDKLLADKLLAPYQELPFNSPEFEKKALELAKGYLNEEEIENIETFMDMSGCARIVLRAIAFSGHFPFDDSCASYDFYERIVDKFAVLPPSDKIAIIKHFDSECKKTDKGYLLIPNEPENGPRESAPEKMEISKEAGEWWNLLGATVIEASNMHDPIMKAVAKALGHEGVQQAEENGGIPPHYLDPFYTDPVTRFVFRIFSHLNALPIDHRFDHLYRSYRAPA